VRGEALLVALVAMCSLVFWAIGEPYFLLIGMLAGLLEVVPVVGPLSRTDCDRRRATVSWHLALVAGVAVQPFGCSRLPRPASRARRRRRLRRSSLVAVSQILLGGFYILLAVPLASFRHARERQLRGHDPAEADVPTVLFPAKDAELKAGP
jgi:hypothetical protein